MASSIADMSLQELRDLIRREIAEVQASSQHQSFNLNEAAEFHEWLKTNRLQREANTPSLNDMLREDRDR